MRLSLSDTYVDPVVRSESLIVLIVFVVSTPKLERYGEGKEESEWIKQGFLMSPILEVGFNIQISTKASHAVSGESVVCYRDSKSATILHRGLQHWPKGEAKYEGFQGCNSDPTTWIPLRPGLRGKG